jgi:phosphatidylinositol glycan class B
MAFGYGNLTWEWQPSSRIRGFLHPLVFAAVYRVFDWIGLANQLTIGCAAHVTQSIFASIGDYFIYKLAEKLHGPRVAKYTLFCLFTCWFLFYSSTRTFSNSIETVLCSVAFYFWPWTDQDFSLPSFSFKRLVALVLAAVACAFRPTSAVIWIFLGSLHVAQLGWTQNWSSLVVLLLQVLVISVCWVAITMYVDFLFYGVWTFVPTNFLLFNVISSGSSLYGTHPWYWYFLEGFPAITGTFFPLFLHGVFSSKRRTLCLVIFVVNAFYSLNPHKEFRFVMPVLPLALIYSGISLQRLSTSLTSRKFAALVTILLMSNVIASAYLSVLHQRGATRVVSFLGSHLSEITRTCGADDQGSTVHFLCGCHSTPWYSALHLPQCPPRMHFLDCSPRPDSLTGQATLQV